MIPSETFCNNLRPHELEVLSAFDANEADYFILEWARRHYKTTLGINLEIREDCQNPLSKYLYIAPTQVWARNVVWDDPVMLWSSLPDKKEMNWQSNDQKMLIEFANGSMLKVCGSDDPDSIRGVDFDGCVLDEFALHDPAVWTKILRPIIAGGPKPGAKRHRWIMFLYTPKGDNHATQLFNISACIESEDELPTTGKSAKHKDRWFCSRLTADVSGIIPQAELDKMLAEVKDGRLSQADYDQEMLCRRVRDEERTLITSAMLDRLNTVDWDSPAVVGKMKHRIVAIDPAFGGDICSIQGIENGKVLKERAVHYTLTSEVVLEAKMVADEIKTKNFIVDCIGNDVAQHLREDAAEYYVQDFQSASKSESSMLCANKKAEAVFYVTGLIRQVKLPPVKDSETRRQLVALSHYKIQQGSGRMIMAPNDEVKKSLGCSPDKGLCYIYGIYGLQHVEPVLETGPQITTFSRAGCVPSTLAVGVA